MVGVAEALANEAQVFGVANLEEAVALREALSHPIIILGPGLPEERSTIVERGFHSVDLDSRRGREFDRIARDKPVAINFKVDTGMGRMGVVGK